MLIPRTAPHLTLLCALGVVGPAAWAQQPIMRPVRVAEPVSDETLANVRGTGRARAGPSFHGEVAVILWDEPKTPRPGGDKGSVVSVAPTGNHIAFRTP